MHFEIESKDGEALRSFYSGLFGWEIDASNPMRYGLLQREGNMNAQGVGIGGAVSDVPQTPSSTWRGPSRAEGYEGHVTVYVEVPDVEAALTKAEDPRWNPNAGPDQVMGGLTMGKFNDPEGHLIGLISPARRPVTRT
jgi:hypothetical protein